MMLAIPAASTTATAPPAMMPVPSGPASAARSRRRSCRQWDAESSCSQRDANQILRSLDALLDRRRHFLRLADAETDNTVAVADDNERAEVRFLPPLTTFVTRLIDTTVSLMSSCDGSIRSLRTFTPSLGTPARLPRWGPACPGRP
jgi:hypothetical protein